MSTKIYNIWSTLRSSFWFLPAVMSVAAVLLSLLTDEADRYFGYDGTRFLYGGSADGARELLAVVAASMITVAGVVFSITIVALSLASQQFGPRLLRNFMRDTGNQFVLGAFIATFVYCIMVLRRVRGGDDAFVPGISIAIAILLSLMSLAVLIYFIHHVATSIQANPIIARVGHDLEKAIDRLYPQRLGEEAAERELTAEDRSLLRRLSSDGASVHADGSGYVKAIDSAGLMSLAVDRDAVIELKTRPGKYAVADAELAVVYPPGEADNALSAEINRTLILDSMRSLDQDVEFSIDQLVEIAVRSLSTGINDPFTAIVVIDRLSAALVKLMGRETPSPYRFDDDGRLRVIAPRPTFGGIMDAAFNQIRQYGGSSAPVLIRLLESLERLAHRATTAEQREAIMRHASMIARAGRENLAEPNDRDDLEERIAAVSDAVAVAAAS